MVRDMRRPSLTRTRPARARAGGMFLVYAMMVMTLLLAFAALAVDFGRVKLVKTELRGVADAAARAGVANIYEASGTAAARAVAVAGQNTADGRAVALVTTGTDPDVVLGRWYPATKQFVAGATPVDAVKVTARRTAARGGAVPVAFAGLLGIGPVDVQASAVARMLPGGFGVVGLDGITMSGNSTMAYWSHTGTTSTRFGSIASNGNIGLSGNAFVNGDARPGVSGTVTGAVGTVTGSTARLTAPLSYPPMSGSAARTSNNNASAGAYVNSSGDFSMSSDSVLSLPGGTYYFKSFMISSKAQLSFTGPATIYCWGSFSLSGSCVTNGALPKNLTIVSCTGPNGEPPGDVSLSGESALYASVYAPLSGVTISGQADLYGSVVGRHVTLSGNGQIRYDLNLHNDANGPSLVE